MNLDRLRAQLILHEDYRDRPYVDTVGQITVGIGHNISAQAIAPDIIERWYTEDVAEALKTCHALYPDFDVYDEVRQRVLLDLAFNLGITKLRKFYATNAAIRRGQWDLAAIHLQDSHWFSQVKTRGPRLVRMLRTGVDAADIP